MALPLPLDPAPASVETLLPLLPARARAELEWFPTAFRAEVVEPLLERGSEELSFRTLEELALPAAHLFVRLASSFAAVFHEDPALLESLLDASRFERVRDDVVSRLRTDQPVAANDLAAALDWLAAITSALQRDYRDLLSYGFDDPRDLKLGEQELRRELAGTLGNFVRGALLASAAIDVIAGTRRVRALPSWCSVALMEIQAAANALRAQGLQIPTALREHNPASLLRRGPLPPGVIERIVGQFDPVEVWLFGSRAAGTHSPTSDYDLLVVVDDTADVDRLTAWGRVAPLRRARLDISAATLAEFEHSKDVPGTLSNIVATEGVRIYERDG